LIVTLPLSKRSRASFRDLNAMVPPRYGGHRENEMEMQKRAIAISTLGIASELLTLALHALVAGLSAALVAGALVIALTVIAA
jgi:hypothetical protein